MIVSPLYLPLLGGQERQVALLADAFRRRGYTVDVLTELVEPGSARHEEPSPGLRIHRVGAVGGRRPLAYGRIGLEMLWFLARHRRRYSFAIVRTLTFPAILVGLLKAMRVIRYPTLATAETGGANDDVIALRSYPGFRTLRWLLQHHDRLNGICETNLAHYRELGFNGPRLTYIYNGIDTAGFADRSFPRQIRTFGFLGRLHPEKGIFELIEAFADLLSKYPETRLLIAGTGESDADLRRVIAARCLGTEVIMLGRIPYEELGSFFEEIDCLVLPSYSEGLPLSVLEAAAHKRVIVATDVSDLRLLFGTNIYLARIGDAADLRRAMERAMRPAGTSGLSYDDVIGKVSIELVAGVLEQALTE